MPDLVPVVDLAASHAAYDVDAARRSVGFMSIVGHDVLRDVIDDMLAATDELFALPLEEKLRLRPPSPNINRGYAAKGSEGLAYSLGGGFFATRADHSTEAQSTAGGRVDAVIGTT